MAGRRTAESAHRKAMKLKYQKQFARTELNRIKRREKHKKLHPNDKTL